MVRGLFFAGTLFALASCATVDVTTGSRLSLPPPGSQPRTPVDVDDVAIVGEQVAHAILALPAIDGAAVPPLVQFTGVTSIVVGQVPVDTEPYTDLLRDRLLLVTRLKLRFIERTLPLLVMAPKKGKHHESAPVAVADSSPDYQILAELRGRYRDELYRIEVQFVDTRTNEVLFDGLYQIRKEASGQADIPSEDTGAPTPPTVEDPTYQPTGAGVPAPSPGLQ